MIIAGDFNARVGRKLEWENQSMNRFNPAEQNVDFAQLPNRENKDQILNNAGRDLIRTCKESGLCIVNGRTCSDKEGDFTFISENGASTIDLVLTDPAMITSNTGTI